MDNLILASSSLRRLELLRSIGYKPDQVIHPEVDETPLKKELPNRYVKRIAHKKGLKVSQKFPTSVVISADTIVTRARMIITKPKDIIDAKKILKMLSGRRHLVYTGVCVMNQGNVIETVVETKVKFKLLTDFEIDNLIESEEWRGKAGGYALQGLAGMYIKWIRGHPSNVIGLPVHETYKILSGMGKIQQRFK